MSNSKRALVVGINDYPGTQSDLLGCVNDARDWAFVLKARGYDVGELLDSDATAASIMAELEDLVLHARDGDSLVFTFSGHGSWLPDTNGDEPDGRDEMLCPYDVASGNYIVDDALHALFSKKPRGARLLAISDSCHSGTVTRYAVNPLADDSAPRPRFLPPLQFMRDADLVEKIPLAATKPIKTLATWIASRLNPQPDAHQALLLSGCRDHEYSYDANFSGRPNGAMTRAAIDALRGNPGNPAEWHKLIRRQLPSRSFPQTPQLFGSNAGKRSPLF